MGASFEAHAYVLRSRVYANLRGLFEQEAPLRRRIDAECVLSTIVNYVSIKTRRLHLHVGGLNSLTGEHVKWQDRSLRVGDEIRIRIASRKWADTPTTRIPRDPVKELESQKHYLREMAKKLGWEIKESD